MFTLEQITHFWTHIAVKGDDECWDWLGHINRDGDGIVQLGDTSYLAYRVAWQLTYGHVMLGRRIIHTCANLNCCNPNHFYREQEVGGPPPRITV